jgi:hypothetical protein
MKGKDKVVPVRVTKAYRGWRYGAYQSVTSVLERSVKPHASAALLLRRRTSSGSEKRKRSCSCLESNHDSPLIQPIVMSLCLPLSTTNKTQRYTIFFISVNVLHVTGGFSAHHQELKTVHTASGISQILSS